MDKDPSSYRDPSGFIFVVDGTIYRQVNQSFAEHYDQLMASGLYDELVKAGLLISHQEVKQQSRWSDQAYKVLKPQQLPFISYPYEWSFSQLKAAALLTLEIQRLALEHDLSLKDASAYNVQFVGYRPIFIDTLSFEIYRPNLPWVGYRQFCQHFLAPLALMAKIDPRLNSLLQLYLDGIPLDMANKLLPRTAIFNSGLAMHLVLHAKSQGRMADTGKPATAYQMPKTAMLGLINSLEQTVRHLSPPNQKTEWGDYYEATNYTPAAEKAKERIISQWLDKIKPKTVWDLGANTGHYSRLAKNTQLTVASDIDPAAVEQNYQQACQEKNESLLPLRIDLTNPSPALGWANTERTAFLQRGPVDAVLCLALVHHLAIANNLPFDMIVDLLADLSSEVIIEFIPKEDSNVQRLLASREDIFPAYTEADFELALKQRFRIIESQVIRESHRVLYWLKPVN